MVQSRGDDGEIQAHKSQSYARGSLIISVVALAARAWVRIQPGSDAHAHHRTPRKHARLSVRVGRDRDLPGPDRKAAAARLAKRALNAGVGLAPVQFGGGPIVHRFITYSCLLCGQL